MIKRPREVRRVEDIERIYPTLLPDIGNSIPLVVALREAFDVSLSTAKMAVSDACDRAKQRW